MSGAERLEARRKAEERLAVVKAQGAKALEDYAKVRQAEVAKTARLRALRLAKDAAELKSADRAGAVPDPVTPAPEAPALEVTAPPKRAPARRPRPETSTNPKGRAPSRGQGKT